MVPDVFGGIQFRTVRRQPEEPDVAGDAQLDGTVPPRLVKKHDAEVVCIERRGVGKEDGHGFAVAPREHQACKGTVMRTDGTEGVDRFAHDLVGGLRTNMPGSPATAGVIDAAEPAFVLKQEPYAHGAWNVGHSRGQQFRKFFYMPLGLQGRIDHGGGAALSCASHGA